MTTTMQKLYFEPAWDKAIAPSDREKIIQSFPTTNKTATRRHPFVIFTESSQL